MDKHPNSISLKRKTQMYEPLPVNQQHNNIPHQHPVNMTIVKKRLISEPPVSHRELKQVVDRSISSARGSDLFASTNDK